MSLRARLNATADRVRAIASRSSIDERPTSVTIRTRTFNAGRRNAEGGWVDGELEILPRPKVREVKQNEIAASAGRYRVGDMRVGPITPAYPSGGGYARDQLAPVVTSNGVDIVYVLDGNIAGDFARVDLTTDRSHSWFLVLRRQRTTP